MKSLVLTLATLSVPLLALLYWLYRPRLAQIKARLSLAARVGAIGYLALVVHGLATSDFSEQQIQTAGLSLAFFGGLWVVAYLITRSLAR